MAFTSEEVELLIQIARDASLGTTFQQRLEAITEALSALIPNTAFSAIVLDLERRKETPRGQIYYKNGRLEDLLPYTSHYVHLDPMFPAIPRGDGHSYVLSDFVPRSRFGRDEYTSDYLKLIHIRHLLGCSHYMPSGQLLSIAVHRDQGLPDFTQKEREILRIASPDIMRAAFGALLRERVAALSETPPEPGIHGAVIFTPEAEVAYGDETGLALARATGASSDGGEEGLRREIGEVATGESQEGFTRERLLRLTDGRWVKLRLSKLQNGPRSSVLALFEALPAGSDALMDAVMSLSRLTPRERGVASLATQGLGNREIGQRLSISTITVGVMLTKIYEKTGTRGRTELTKLLLCGAY